MILCCITTDPTQHPERFNSFLGSEKRIEHDEYVNIPNIGVVPPMQLLFEKHSDQEIICWVHSDVTVYDPTWADRVYDEFKDPKVAVVGFGGATGIGTDWIYRERYQIEQLQRINYASNDVEWETHGGFEDGAKDVAVCDGFFLAIRTAALKEIGGWKGFGFNFHMYDAYISLALAERDWKTRMVGVKCHHHGGGTSTSESYKRWCIENGTTMEREHEAPHKFIYERFRDILPLRIK